MILIDRGNEVLKAAGAVVIRKSAVLEAVQTGGTDPDRSFAVFKDRIDLSVSQPLRLCVGRDGLLTRPVQPVIKSANPDIAFLVSEAHAHTILSILSQSL